MISLLVQETCDNDRNELTTEGRLVETSIEMEKRLDLVCNATSQCNDKAVASQSSRKSFCLLRLYHVLRSWLAHIPPDGGNVETFYKVIYE